MERNLIEKRSKRNDDRRERGQSGCGPHERGTPPAKRSRGEHDGKCFDDFDE